VGIIEMGKGGARRKVVVVFAEAIAELEMIKSEKKKHKGGIDYITINTIGGLGVNEKEGLRRGQGRSR
jgi:hypothetical protein